MKLIWLSLFDKTQKITKVLSINIYFIRFKTKKLNKYNYFCKIRMKSMIYEEKFPTYFCYS